MFLTFIAVCILCGCFAITNGQQNAEADSSKPRSLTDLCLTPECIYEATRILKNMNNRTKPCDDFYDFVCGNYDKPAKISETESKIHPFITGMLEVDYRLRSIIEDIDELREPKDIAKLKTSYNECMKRERKSNKKTMSKTSLLSVEIDAWQTLSQHRWKPALFHSEYVTRHLFKIDKKLDATNIKSKILELSIRRPPIPWSYLKEGLSNEAVRAYFSYMKDILDYLGFNKTLEQPRLKGILNFEIELAKIILSENEDYDINNQYTKTRLGKLNSEYPNLRLMELSNQDDDNLKVQMKMNPDIIGKLEEWMLGKSKRALAHWLTWRWTIQRAQKLGSYGDRRLKKLQQVVYGYAKTEAKWRHCVKEVRSKFPFFLDLLYYGQYMSKSVVKDSTEIFANVKEQFTNFIKEAEWLGASTKGGALEKVGNMRNNIGAYEEFMAKRKLNGLKLSSSLLATNRADVFQISVRSYVPPGYETRETMEKWNFVKTITHYIGEFIFLNVGAGMYTSDFYNIDRPKALNYGAFGSLIGHELAHSLDDTNRHVDKNGNFHQWWDFQSNETYVERTHCLVEQYRKYGFEQFGFYLRTFGIRDEDIADNAGVKAAYFAYDKWAKKNKPEKQLPGLDYTPRQMFWISFANTQCSKLPPKHSRTGIDGDLHSPEKLRIKIPVSNMPEFANDFKCSRGSKMNPVNKCSVW